MDKRKDNYLFQGNKPIHTAAIYDHADGLQILLRKNKESVNKTNHRKETPLHLAVRYGHTQCAELLIENGASLQAVDNIADTPIHTAIQYRQTSCLQLLLEHGSSVVVLNRTNDSPLEAAEELHDKSLVAILQLRVRTFIFAIKEYSQQFFSQRCFSEISGLDVETEDEFKNMLSTASYRCYWNRSYLVGPYNVGKTTLAKNLVDDPISEERRSTDGIWIYLGRAGMNIDDRKWIFLPQGWSKEDEDQYLDVNDQVYVETNNGATAEVTKTLLNEPQQNAVSEPDIADNINTSSRTPPTPTMAINRDQGKCEQQPSSPSPQSEQSTQQEKEKTKVIKHKTKLTASIEELFKDHTGRKHLEIDHLFFVNARDKDDPEVDQLRKTIVDVAFSHPRWGELMPTVCVPLDIQLMQRAEEGMKIMSIKEIEEINSANGVMVLTQSQLTTFLKIQHALGKYIYFNEGPLNKYAVIDPTYLVEVLRSVVTEEEFWPKTEDIRNIYVILRDKGILTKADLLKLWEQEEYRSLEGYKDYMIKMLIHLDILIEPRSSFLSEIQVPENEIFYLVPCMIKQPAKRPNIKVDSSIYLAYAFNEKSYLQLSCTDFLVALCPCGKSSLCLLIAPSLLLTNIMNCLGELEIEQCPTDQQIGRLVAGLKLEVVKELFVHLEMPMNKWDDIEHNYPCSSDLNMFALWEWKQKAEMPTFGALKYALTKVNQDFHKLCEVSQYILTDTLTCVPDESILENLSNSIGNDNMQLGLELGLKGAELQDIAFQHKTRLMEQTREIFRRWSKRRQPLSVLAKAFIRIDKFGVFTRCCSN
ncbi:unnamed protein product [Mytilus edulis]|uniref:Death domain-containing protein n=1 Tax=Mytilus edulis TaxID=6550 RepID=A0A8S3TF02_MYTED|nr:unnamed protein product [Mytilus edulis]